MNKKCPVCNSQNTELLYNLKDSHVVAGIPGIVHSYLTCSMLFKSFDTDIETIYLSNDWSEEQLTFQYSESKWAMKFFEGVLRSNPFNNMHNKTGKTLLDIGSARGALLEVARNINYDASGGEI